MNKTFTGSAIAAAVAMMTLTNQAARADYSTTTTSSSGSYITAPYRMFKKTVFMPFHMFGGSSSKIASTTVTTTTTGAETVVLGAAGPTLLVTDPVAPAVLVPSVISAAPGFVTTGATITAFKSYWPNDLLTRRDDLIARIYLEKANGKLSDSQAVELISQVNGVLRAPLIGDEFITANARHVKFMYRDFDRVSNNIYRESRMGNRQLAGKYNVIVL